MMETQMSLTTASAYVKQLNVEMDKFGTSAEELKNATMAIPMITTHVSIAWFQDAEMVSLK